VGRGRQRDEHAAQKILGRRDRRRAVTSPATARPSASSAAAPASAPVRIWDGRVDRLASSDPGLNWFRMALQILLTMATPAHLGEDCAVVVVSPQVHRRHHGPDGRSPQAHHHRLRHRTRRVWQFRRLSRGIITAGSPVATSSLPIPGRAIASTSRSFTDPGRVVHHRTSGHAAACTGPFGLVVAGGDLLRSHRDPRQRRRRPGIDRLTQQLRHRVPRVITQRPVKRDVRERAVAQLPGAEGGVSLAAGNRTRLRNRTRARDARQVPRLLPRGDRWLGLFDVAAMY
jgi:hypothetical protein